MIKILTIKRLHYNISYVNVYYKIQQLTEEEIGYEKQIEVERCVSSSSYPF